MTNTKTLLKALLSATALTVFTTGTAQAQDKTLAGETVSNTFSLDYKVGGVIQPQIVPPATTDFTVDRLVDLTVSSLGDANVSPGGTDVVLPFSVTNEGNDTHAYALTIYQESGTPLDTIDSIAPVGTVDAITYQIDDGDGSFDAVLDGTVFDYDPANPPVLGPDDVLWVFVTQDIAATATDGDQADVSLGADSLDAVSFAAVTGDTGGNLILGAAENVLADGVGTRAGEAANAGDHSDTGTYIVASADLSGVKTVTIHNDTPADVAACTTIPGTATGGYGIPGACVEYVITVQNTGSVDATDVVVSDTLPEELLFASAQIGGDFTGALTFTGLPALNADCDIVACVIELSPGTSLEAPTGVTPTEGTVTIRAYVK